MKYRETVMAALRFLAEMVIDGCDLVWVLVDRIEKRYKLQGYANNIVQRQKVQVERARLEFLIAYRATNFDRPDVCALAGRAENDLAYLKFRYPQY